MNVGRAAAEGVPVRLSVDGAAAGTVTVPVVYAKGSKTRDRARARNARTGSARQVDPDGLIAESWEQDNTHLLACQDLVRR